jgi:hypothetical protein
MSRAVSTPKGAAGVIAGLITQAGLDLPVRLRAWDGSGAGPADPLDATTEDGCFDAIAFEQGRMGVDQILAQRPRR